MQLVPSMNRTRAGFAALSIALLLAAPEADAGRPRPATPDAPKVSIVAVGEFVATGWISACARDGFPVAACTQQIRVVPRGGACDAEAVATASPAADETWDTGGLSTGTEYTLYGVITNAGGEKCSDPLDLRRA